MKLEYLLVMFSMLNIALGVLIAIVNVAWFSWSACMLTWIILISIGYYKRKEIESESYKENI